MAQLESSLFLKVKCHWIFLSKALFSRETQTSMHHLVSAGNQRKSCQVVKNWINILPQKNLGGKRTLAPVINIDVTVQWRSSPFSKNKDIQKTRKKMLPSQNPWKFLESRKDCRSSYPATRQRNKIDSDITLNAVEWKTGALPLTSAHPFCVGWENNWGCAKSQVSDEFGTHVFFSVAIAFATYFKEGINLQLHLHRPKGISWYWLDHRQGNIPWISQLQSARWSLLKVFLEKAQTEWLRWLND